jgi:hypothetical protein
MSLTREELKNKNAGLPLVKFVIALIKHPHATIASLAENLKKRWLEEVRTI